MRTNPKTPSGGCSITSRTNPGLNRLSARNRQINRPSLFARWTQAPALWACHWLPRSSFSALSLYCAPFSSQTASTDTALCNVETHRQTNLVSKPKKACKHVHSRVSVSTPSTDVPIATFCSSPRRTHRPDSRRSQSCYHISSYPSQSRQSNGLYVYGAQRTACPSPGSQAGIDADIRGFLI